MDVTEALQLIADARADPGSGYAIVRDALAAEPADDVRATLLRGLGELARWVTSMADSTDLLHQSIAAARAAGRDDLARDAMLTLSGTRYLAGDPSGAMAALDEAGDGAVGHFAAKVDFQRATILGREGRTADALAAYARALPIFRAADDHYFVAATLGNRALVLLERGEARAAAADLALARDGFRAAGVPISAAGMEHNLGRAVGQLGDVSSALRHFRASEIASHKLGLDSSEVQVNRGEVLLQAGLYEEAEEVAARTAAAMVHKGLAIDRAEALFVLSQALLGQLRMSDAAVAASEAATLLHEQGRRPRALRAEVVAARAGAADPRDVTTLAQELTELGQLLAAGEAWTVVARTDPAAALAGLRQLPLPSSELPLEHRLAVLEVQARERWAVGDAGGARTATTAAVDLGNGHRSVRGSADLRAAVSAQLDSVARFGLQVRRDHGSAWDVLRWVDRCRDSSRGTDAPRPDEEREDLLATLRAVQRATRNADVDTMPDLLREQARLQRRLVTADRHAGGRAHTSSALPRDLAARLDGVMVVQHHVHDGHLAAVVVASGAASIIQLGAVTDVTRHAEQLQRALRKLALQYAAGVADERTVSAVQRHAAALQATALPAGAEPPIDGPDEPVVIVPTAAHLGVPWSLLPALTARQVTVAPSVRHWLATAAQDTSISSVGLVEGVHLDAPSEVAALARLWREQRPQVLMEPTVSATLELLQHVDLVHLACHGSRRARDGRFAQLRLADGDLVSFELEHLPRSPRVVVLAACEAGLLEPLPGDETAGIATALFAAGTASVIAPVVVVPDTAFTRQLFVAVHHGMAAGRSPVQALRDAQAAQRNPVEALLARSVSCFGRG